MAAQVLTEAERQALTVLQAGGVVAAATETLFALLADASNPAAVTKVFDLKHRDLGKGVALLLPNREAWSGLVERIPQLASDLADRFWPGPLTIALPAESTLDARLVVNGTVAVRWPASSAAASIAGAFGRPLTATSCNVVGQPACTTSEEVARAFAEPLARGELHVLAGVAPGGAPSTIVGLDGDQLRILREGAIAAAALAQVVAQGNAR